MKQLLAAVLMIFFIGCASAEEVPTDIRYGVVAGLIATNNELELGLGSDELLSLAEVLDVEGFWDDEMKNDPIFNSKIRMERVAGACGMGMGLVLAYAGIMTPDQMENPSEQDEKAMTTLGEKIFMPCWKHYWKIKLSQ